MEQTIKLPEAAIKEIYLSQLIIKGKQKVSVIGYVKLDQKCTRAFGLIPYSKLEGLLMGGGQTGLSVMRKVNDIWEHPHSPEVDVNLTKWFGTAPVFKTNAIQLKAVETIKGNEVCFIKIK
jgi:hypothetical protein